LQSSKGGVVKGPWKPEEDAIILKCLAEGIIKWSEIAERITGRIGKQCRERYFNHLDRAFRRVWARVGARGRE
jgi:myb proto-oncogene protein